MRWLLTAEHAGQLVPEKWAYLFSNASEHLLSHRGYDPGTLSLTHLLSPFADGVAIYHYTRLLIEVNRSLGHTQLFSEITKPLLPEAKQQIIDAYYLQHWRSVEQQIRRWQVAGHTVYHIGIHSFTPELHGNVRTTDIGLLYDPAITIEKKMAEYWQKILQSFGLKVRKNYPYLGKTDGLITQMRRKFPDHYCGIELEINQKYVDDNQQFAATISDSIQQSFIRLKDQAIIKV